MSISLGSPTRSQRLRRYWQASTPCSNSACFFFGERRVNIKATPPSKARETRITRQTDFFNDFRFLPRANRERVTYKLNQFYFHAEAPNASTQIHVSTLRRMSGNMPTPFPHNLRKNLQLPAMILREECDFPFDER